jgi:hypothetical protein
LPGGTSGAPADWYLAIIFTIRDGRTVRGEEYFDPAEALEAAGLAEQDAGPRLDSRSLHHFNPPP